MGDYSKQWNKWVEQCVVNSLEESDEPNGISKAYRYFRQHAPDKEVLKLKRSIAEWKEKAIQYYSMITLRDRLVRVLRGVPELFSILFPLAHCTVHRLHGAHLSQRQLDRIEDNLLDSWVTKLLGNCLTLYVALSVKRDRVLGMDPQTCDVLDTLDVDPKTAFEVAHRYFLPALKKFCCSQRMVHQALVFYVNYVLLNIEPENLYTYCFPSRLNRAVNKITGDTILHLVVSSPTPTSGCTKIWATSILLAYGADMHQENKSGVTCWDLAIASRSALLTCYFSSAQNLSLTKQVIATQYGKVNEMKTSRPTIQDVKESVSLLETDVQQTNELLAVIMKGFAKVLDV